MNLCRLYPGHPEYYHGLPGRRPYFEGWYFRHTDGGGENTLSVIPGLMKCRSGQQYAFIQGVAGPGARSFFVRYPAQSFFCARDPFLVAVGDSRFSLEGVELHLEAPGIRLTGHAEYGPLNPPARVMGPFAFMPGMQCSHGILSLHHDLTGHYSLNGAPVTLDGGWGYMEKDWGSAFPSAWVWLQAGTPPGHREPVFLSCSAAAVPLAGRRMTGLIAILEAGGRQYRFATYNGGRVEGISREGGEITLLLSRGPWRLWITARAEAFAPLRAPGPGGMERVVHESVEGALRVRLSRNHHLLMDRELSHAGVEWTDAGTLR